MVVVELLALMQMLPCLKLNAGNLQTCVDLIDASVKIISIHFVDFALRKG